MKKFLLFLFLSFYALQANAQINTDSLWQFWKDERQSDSLRLNALQRMAWDGFLFTNPDSAYQLAQLRYDYAASKDMKGSMASALNVQAISFHIRGNLSQALEYYERSQRMFEETGGLAGAASVLNNIGIIYYDRGDLPRALDAYIKTLDFSLKSGDTDVGNILQNIGLIYLDLEEYEKALGYFNQSIEAHQQHGNETSIANVITNRGLVYKRNGEPQKAIQEFEESLLIMNQLNNNSGSASALNNLGSVYLELDEWDLAMEYFKKSLALKNELDDQRGIVSSTANIGLAYRKKGQYQEALQWCSEALELAEQIGALEDELSCNECLYATYKNTGNYSKALQHYERMTVLKDSLFNEESTKKLTQLEMQYEFDKKEAATQAEQEKREAIAAKELEREKLVKNGFVGGFAVVLLFAVVFFVQRNKIGKEKERSEELLLNILPEETAQELKEKGESEARLIDQVTVLFTDFKGFTTLSEKLTPKELVADLHECFSAFDRVCEKYGIEKIKTIGDAYMAAGGLPTPNTTHAQDVIKAALEMTEIVQSGKYKKVAAQLPYFEVRIGIHTGPVVAGIVGVKKFQYDIWGDTVNSASRMESHGEVGKVNISEATYTMVKNESEFQFTSRGKIHAKGKGAMEMFFVSRA